MRWLLSTLATVFLLVSVAHAAPTVTLTWQAPTTNADGTPLTDLAGYRVYMAMAPITDKAGDAKVADVPAGTTEATVDVGPLPAPGALVYFRATAYDTNGNESALSNETVADFLPPSTVTLTIRFAP